MSLDGIFLDAGNVLVGFGFALIVYSYLGALRTRLAEEIEPQRELRSS